MDPAAATLEFLTSRDANRKIEIACELRGWYAHGGFRPLLCNIKASLRARNMGYTKHRKALAILCGAI